MERMDLSFRNQHLGSTEKIIISKALIVIAGIV